MAARGGIEKRLALARQIDRHHHRHIGNVCAAGVRRVKHIGIAVLHAVRALLKNHSHAFTHGAEMHRHMRRVSDEIALAIENCAGEIESLLDIDRVTRIGKRYSHLLRNRHK